MAKRTDTKGYRTVVYHTRNLRLDLLKRLHRLSRKSKDTTEAWLNTALELGLMHLEGQRGKK